MKIYELKKGDRIIHSDLINNVTPFDELEFRGMDGLYAKLYARHKRKIVEENDGSPVLINLHASTEIKEVDGHYELAQVLGKEKR